MNIRATNSIGLNEHYAEHTRMAGWDDLRFPAQGINPAGGAVAASVDIANYPGTLTFPKIQSAYIAGVAQMPHKWLKASSIIPHIHWSKTSTDAGGVGWEIRHFTVDNGQTASTYSTWIEATVEISDSDISGKMAYSDWPAVTMTGLKESCMLAWQIRRNTTSAIDTYGTSARLWEFDIHYQVDKFGTTAEIPT